MGEVGKMGHPGHKGACCETCMGYGGPICVDGCDYENGREAYDALYMARCEAMEFHNAQNCCNPGPIGTIGPERKQPRAFWRTLPKYNKRIK